MAKTVNMTEVAAAVAEIQELHRKRDGYAVELAEIERALTPDSDNVDEIERELRARSARRDALRLSIGKLDSDIARRDAELQQARCDAAMVRYSEHLKVLGDELETACDALDNAAAAFTAAASTGHAAMEQKRIFDGASSFNAYSRIDVTAAELTKQAQQWRQWLARQREISTFWQ